MISNAYDGLRAFAGSQIGLSWLAPLVDESERLLASQVHGDLPRWRDALASLPVAEPRFDGRPPAPQLGGPVTDAAALRESLMALHPWRKGPLVVGGVAIDTEWRSDWKWDRVAGRFDLDGHAVLDIGCGNGYFGWRLLGAGARCVIGVDPTLVFVMQWLACRHFAGPRDNYVLPLGVEHLPREARVFDTVFSMGVLYHRKDPVAHLVHLAGLARPGGRIVLETLVLEGDDLNELVPEGRYARMRNVWAVPTIPRLQAWLVAAGLPDVEVLHVGPTTTDEQRSTDWMRFESLDRCLDPEDHQCTVEGHPAPVRAALLIEVPGLV